MRLSERSWHLYPEKTFAEGDPSRVRDPFQLQFRIAEC
jgi:hypothetical protein